MVGILGREEGEPSAVAANGIEKVVIGMASRLATARREEHPSRDFVDGDERADDPVAARNLMLDRSVATHVV